MNPFIELFRSPVATLTALGYAGLLFALLWLTSAGLWRNAITLRVRWERQRPGQWEYVPPGSFIGRVAAFPALLWIDAWVLAALIWLVTP